MSGMVAWGALFGLTLGLGLWSIVAALPRFAGPRLADRVAPYVLDVSEEAQRQVSRTTVSPLPLIGTLFGPLANRLRRSLSSLLGGGATIERRLRQSGSTASVEDFRGTQLVWLALAFVAGVLVLLGVAPFRSVPSAVRIALPLVAAVSAFLFRDWLLQRAAAARMRRIASEFPTVLEFLTLSLSAGEGILDAFRRVSGTSSGELSREFAAVVAEVNTGVPLGAALTALRRRTELPILDRCIDAILGALEHGSPLAEVLRAQAQDARVESKRQLLETAGKKEVAMMVPVNTYLGYFYTVLSDSPRAGALLSGRGRPASAAHPASNSRSCREARAERDGQTPPSSLVLRGEPDQRGRDNGTRG